MVLLYREITKSFFFKSKHGRCHVFDHEIRYNTIDDNKFAVIPNMVKYVEDEMLEYFFRVNNIF